MTTSDNNGTPHLSFEEFKELIHAEIAKRLGSGFDASLISVCKNNSIRLEGLAIRKANSPLGPNLYLNEPYREYTDGKDIETIIKELILQYHEFLRTTVLPNEAASFAFEEIKDRIIYCLVGAASNREILSLSPFVPYLDFAIIFQYLVYSDSRGISTVRITNEHLKIWKTTVEELFYHARMNTPSLLPFRLFKMSDLLGFATATPMRVLTNSFGLQGASCILYPNLLKNFAETLHSGFFLIPSSIHEFLILPLSSQTTPPTSEAITQEKDALSEIVREINSSQLKPEDVLTHHAYYYDPITETIE